MPDINLEVNEKEFRSLWGEVKRPGVDSLLAYLGAKTDFFAAPSSTEFHLAVPGGLVEHSLNVCKPLIQKAGWYNTKIGRETCIVAGLGHDLCKANFYVRGTRNVKENGVWVAKQIWQVADQFPMGHGEKSVSILQDFIPLTEEEKLAIRWHMTAFDPSIHFNYPNGFAFRSAAAKCPLVTLLFTADYEASNLLEA